MSICPHCRLACETMSAGRICCVECASEILCAACLVAGVKRDMEWFGDDPICPHCLPEIVADSLDSDYVPVASDDSDSDYVSSDEEAS